MAQILIVDDDEGIRSLIGEFLAKHGYDARTAADPIAMREMLARFIENGGDTPCKTLAQSVRLNWAPSWGKDPGPLDEFPTDIWDV